MRKLSHACRATLASRPPRRDSNPSPVAVPPRVARAPPLPHRRYPRAARRASPRGRGRALPPACARPRVRGGLRRPRDAPHPTPPPAPEPGNLRRWEEGAGWERGGANNGGKAQGGAAKGNPRPVQMELLRVCNVSAGSLAPRPWGRGVARAVCHSGYLHLWRRLPLALGPG